MGAYLNHVNQQNFFSNGEADPLGESREAYPELADAFKGQKGEDGRWVAGPATLLIFPEGDKLKFCLSPKGVSWVIFGEVSDPQHVFESVDCALAQGRCERKQRRGRN